MPVINRPDAVALRPHQNRESECDSSRSANTDDNWTHGLSIRRPSLTTFQVQLPLADIVFKFLRPQQQLPLYRRLSHLRVDNEPGATLILPGPTNRTQSVSDPGGNLAAEGRPNNQTQPTEERVESTASGWQRGWEEPETGSRQKRVDQVLGLLGLFNEESDRFSTVLICCGRATNCRVIPVRIRYEADEEEEWQCIRDAWYGRRRNHWWKAVIGFDVKEVYFAAKISLAGPVRKSLGQNTEFVGTYKALEGHETRIQQLKEKLEEYMTQSEHCFYNPSTGRIKHDRCGVSCLMEEWEESEYGDFTSCPADQYYYWKRQLSREESRFPLVLAFQDPALATGNELMPSILYSPQDVLSLVHKWHLPTLRELEFRGLVIEEGWLLPRWNYIGMLTGVIIIMAVLGRLAFGGWDAAWGFAGCVVAVIALLTRYY